MAHQGRAVAPETLLTLSKAEAVAFFVSHAIGLGTNTASADYVMLYNRDKQILVESLSYIKQTASQILTVSSPGEEPGPVSEGPSAASSLAPHTYASTRQCLRRDDEKH